MHNKINEFDIGKWVVKLLNTSQSYFRLLDFIYDEEAFELHTNNRIIYSGTKNNFEIIQMREMDDLVTKRYLTDGLREDLEHAIDNYSNQIIVILATYLETIHSEFFQSLFSKNNKFIYNYASDSIEHRGYIKMDLILDSQSKDDMMDKLIKNAKKNILNGSLKKINEKIFKITKYQIEKKLIDDIQNKIVDRRNDIVHEAKASMIKSEEISILFDLIEKYLFE